MVNILPLRVGVNRVDASCRWGLITTSASPDETRLRLLARAIPWCVEVSTFTYETWRDKCRTSSVYKRGDQNTRDGKEEMKDEK
jgi:hypothetical protein